MSSCSSIPALEVFSVGGEVGEESELYKNRLTPLFMFLKEDLFLLPHFTATKDFLESES